MEKFEAPLWVIQFGSFQWGYDIVPGLGPFLPILKLNLFGIMGTDGASLLGDLSPAERARLLNYQKQINDLRIKAPVSRSETPRTVVLASDGRNIPQVDLGAMELPIGSRVIVMAPAQSKLKAYERYAKVKIPGVMVRRGESEGEFPSLAQLQKIFRERLDSIPILIFPPGFDQLESFKQAADREGFVISMPWRPRAQVAISHAAGHSLPRNLLEKVPGRIVNFRAYSDALSPFSIPVDSEIDFAETYLTSLTTQRQLEMAA